MHFSELAAITGGKLYQDRKDKARFRGVSIDSRAIEPQQLFIAIKGPYHDGHDYINQAIQRGASGIMVEFDYPLLKQGEQGVGVVAVKNSHQAMIDLAHHYRQLLPANFIAITGSNGKTTTKEFTYRLIRAVENDSFCSPGNFNNLFGIPLALLSVAQETKVVILELGISTKDEMTPLAKLVNPDLIVITNVGPTHLEFLSSVEEVARAKFQLVHEADPSVPVIINADDDILMREAHKTKRNFITFGINNEADFKVDNFHINKFGETEVTIENHLFNLPLMGQYQIYNLLAAYATFRTLGYDFDNFDTRQISLDTAPMRGQRLVKDNITFIADCYNANPTSVKAGLQAFFDIETDQRRVVILGDMLELGEKAIFYHREIGKFLANRKFDKAILVGQLSRYVKEEAVKQGNESERFILFDDVQEATKAAKDYLQSGDFVYIKGSRGIGLEAVLEMFAEEESKS